MLKVYRRTKTAILPTKAYEGDAGWDLYYDGLIPIFIKPHSTEKIPTGISVLIPKGEVGMIKDKSGVATKQNVSVIAGVLDHGYTGEVIVALSNRADNVMRIDPQQKIAQMLLVKCDTSSEVEEVKELPDTDRKDGGFGSTGINL